MLGSVLNAPLAHFSSARSALVLIKKNSLIKVLERIVQKNY